MCAYDGAGWAATTTMPNGVTTVDAADQTVLADYQYALDGLGNRIGTTGTLTVTVRVITQTYDALNRLTSSAYSPGTPFAHTYDAVGNRAVMTSVTPISGTVVTTYTFDAANPVSVALRRTNGRPPDREVSDGRTCTYTWSNRGQMQVVWTNGYAVRTFTYTLTSPKAKAISPGR